MCYGNTAGVKITACDYDETPQVILISRSLAYVSRKGSLSLNGYVTAKVYCYDDISLGSDSKHKEEKPLSVHTVPDSRRELRAYRRVLRSLDEADVTRDQGTLQALLDTHHSAESPDTRHAETAHEKLTTNARQMNNVRFQDKNDLHNSKQAADNQQMTQTEHQTLDSHIRQAALAQAHHQASKKVHIDKQSLDKTQNTGNRHKRHALHSSDSSQPADAGHDAQLDTKRQANSEKSLEHANLKKNTAEIASNGHRQTEQKRSRRDTQSSNNRQDTEEIDEGSEENGSRAGSQRLYSETDKARQAANAVREVLAANTRHATLAQGSLQTLNDARRAASISDARQASGIFHQALENNALQAALAQESLRAIQEAASRTAQSNDALHADETLREALAANERETRAEQVLQTVHNVNRNSQAVPSRQIYNALHAEFADNTQKSTLNKAHRDALIETQRRTQISPALNARQAADLVRNVLAENAREASVSQHRLQALNEAIRSAQSLQNLDSRQSNEALTDNARHAALYQARQHAELESRLADARRLISNRRLRRATELSDTSKATDTVRDAKADKTHKTHSHKNTSKKARIADQKLDTLRVDDQKRSRRALQFLGSNRQADDTFQNALTVNLRQLASNQRQGNLRQAALHQTHLQNLPEASRAAQTQDFQEYLAPNAHQTNLAQAQRKTANIRHLGDYARETLSADARQDTYGQSHHQAVDKANRYNTNRGTLALHERQEQARLESLQGTERAAQATNLRQQADLVHQTLGTNSRQIVLDNARFEEIQKASKIAQEANERQLADVLRESLKTTKARQIAAEQARRQIHEILRSGQEQQNDAKTVDVVRQALTENARKASLEQAHHSALQNDGRQTANMDHETLVGNSRQTALGQDHRQGLNQARQSAQTANSHQTAEAIQRAAYEPRLAKETSLRNSQLQATYSRYF